MGAIPETSTTPRTSARIEAQVTSKPTAKLIRGRHFIGCSFLSRSWNLSPGKFQDGEFAGGSPHPSQNKGDKKLFALLAPEAVGKRAKWGQALYGLHGRAIHLGVARLAGQTNLSNGSGALDAKRYLAA
jgi:hypothetical protein